MWHSYSTVVIQLAISLVLEANLSFRAVSKAFVQMNIYLNLNMRTPSHTTVLNWTKKQGVANFHVRSYFKRKKWILMADESVQFGNKKLLLVVAVPANRPHKTGALQFNDLTTIVLQVNKSWSGEAIAAEIEKNFPKEQIAYSMSDSGNNLIKAFKSLECQHVEDINHKFSLIVQHTLEGDASFIAFTKKLAELRAKYPFSDCCRIVPPQQRVMSRYMNLMPLFSWGLKMLELMPLDQLTDKERKILSFLPEQSEFILQIGKLLQTLEGIQTLMKTKGLSKAQVEVAKSMLETHGGIAATRIKADIYRYFNSVLSNMKDDEIRYCSTDIIESCFGRYKELVKNNKSVGISDLCLCISAFTGGKRSTKSVTSAMEKVSIKKKGQWQKKHIGTTLAGEKRMLFKKG